MSERITLRRRGVVWRMMGLPPLALGLIVGIGVGLIGGIDLGALLFGLACVAIGIVVIGRHDSVTLDLGRREVVTVGGVIVPLTRRLPLSSLQRVAFRRVVVPSSNEFEAVRWPVHLEGDGVRLVAAVEKDAAAARQRAEELAGRLQLPVVDRTTGTAQLRETGEIGATLKARLADAPGELPPATGWVDARARIPEGWEPPGYAPLDPAVAARARRGVAPVVSSDADGVTWRIPAMGLTGAHARAVAVPMLAILGVAVLASCLAPPAICGGLGLMPLGLIALLPHRDQIFRTQTVRATPDHLEVQAHGRTIRVELDALEELVLTDGSGLDGIRTLVGGGALVAIAPKRRVRFGESLSRPELERLHRELCAWIARA